MWRGAALAEFAEPFARLEEARLVEQHLTCLEECLDAELALGRHAELVAELDTLVRRQPLRERLRGQLMLALYRCGRHAEALEAFQGFRRMLQEDLGIDPPPRLKELERLVLQQDPSLDLVTRTEPTDPEVPPAGVHAAVHAPIGTMEFRILGPLEVRAGERVVPVGGLRRRAVLGLLLLEANRVVPVDRLVDGVWGDDPPASAQASLQNHLVRLRRELGDRLVTRPPGYLLRVTPGELDLDTFRHLVGEADGAEPAAAADRLREALALWRGPGSPISRQSLRARRPRTSTSSASRRSRSGSTPTLPSAATCSSSPSWRSSSLSSRTASGCGDSSSSRSTARGDRRTRWRRTPTRAARSSTSWEPSPGASCRSCSGRCYVKIPRSTRRMPRPLRPRVRNPRSRGRS